MPLVNTPQIPQDWGRDAQPTHPVAQRDMFKMAGAEAALIDLGILPPQGMEKEAWLAPALTALRGVGGKILSRLGGKAVASGGQAATQAAGAAAKSPGLWARTGGRAVGAVANPMGRAGNWAVQRGGQAVGASPAAIGKVQGLGKGMAREAVGFGLFSGGLNAATAEEGQRGKAFLRGAASGALGGLAWRGAGNLATAGLKKGLGAGAGGAARLQGVQSAAKQPWFGKLEQGQSRMKGIGAKALMGGVPFAAGMGASMYMPTFEGGHGGQQTQAQRYAPYAARLGGGVMGAYPQSMRGHAYNPNLPLPQNGY